MLIRWNRRLVRRPVGVLDQHRAARAGARGSIARARSRAGQHDGGLRAVGPGARQVGLAGARRADQGQAAAMPVRPGVQRAHGLGVGGRDDEVLAPKGRGAPSSRRSWRPTPAYPKTKLTAQIIAESAPRVDDRAVTALVRRNGEHVAATGSNARRDRASHAGGHELSARRTCHVEPPPGADRAGGHRWRSGS